MTPSTTPRRHRLARTWLPTLAAATALLSTATVVARNADAATPTSATTGTMLAWPTPQAPPTITTAGLLHHLAASIQDAPADRRAGPYTYHHLRRWILDTTGTPAPRPHTPAVFAIDIRRWEAADGSGLSLDRTPPPAYHLTAARPDHRSTDREFADTPTTRTTYRAGNLSSLITTPLAIDPQQLAHQLAYDPHPDGPQTTLRAIDELYTNHHVTRPTRAAVLKVLAGVDGLTYQSDAIDRAGRHGFAVSLDATTDLGKLRFTLTFDTTTGHLLASSQQLIGPHTYLPIPVGLVMYYTLFVDQGPRADMV